MRAMLTIDVDLKSLTAGFNELQREQVPYAMMKSLNATVLDVQAAERAHIHGAFNVRRAAWVDASVKVTHFAKKTELWATIAISPPGGASRADILGKFETDTVKRPVSGHSVAIPVEAKRNKSDIITRANRPRQVLDQKGTFIVRLPGGRGLILKRQRASRGKLVRTYDDDDRVTSSVRVGAREARNVVLFVLAPEVHIPPDLRFVPTAAEVVDRLWATRFGEAFSLAMATAR